MKKILTLALSISLLITGCTKNALTGKSHLSLISESQLQEMAVTEYRTFLSQNKVVSASGNKDAEMVKRVGTRIANAISSYYATQGKPDILKGYEWEFNLVDNKDVNAWCMPGGKVVVYTGLLPIAQNEAALAVVLGYSYTKRFTPLCHLILGLGLSLAPIGAYLAVTGQFALLPVLFSLAVIFWVSGFDIIYALQDEEFDKSQQLYSIPSWLGKAKALRVSEFLHLVSAAAVVSAAWYGNFGWLYWTGTAVFTGMLVYQHSIVKPTDLRKVNLAFMTANGIASVVFAIFVIADLFIN